MERKVKRRKAAIKYLNLTTSCATQCRNPFEKDVCCCQKNRLTNVCDDVNRRIR